MKKIRLSIDDIQEQNENALDLFYSGIKSKETKRTMERISESFSLRSVLIYYMETLNRELRSLLNLHVMNNKKPYRSF